VFEVLFTCILKSKIHGVYIRERLRPNKQSVRREIAKTAKSSREKKNKKKTNNSKEGNKNQREAQ